MSKPIFPLALSFQIQDDTAEMETEVLRVNDAERSTFP